MGTFRRAVTLIGLAVAIPVAGSFPASATFSESVGITTAARLVGADPRISVTTLTATTWTAESVRTRIAPC